MCWNWQASIGMFVAGMIATTAVVALAIRQKKWNVVALGCAWYLVVVMQLFEFFAWRGERSVGFAAAFFAANAFQVVATFIALAVVCEDADRAWLIVAAGFAVAAYLGIIITTAIKDRPFNIPRDSKHLVYPWWETGYGPGIAYIAALIVVFLCLGRPWKWSLLTLSTILVALLASSLSYRRHIASMWCFFAVLIPILFYAYSFW